MQRHFAVVKVWFSSSPLTHLHSNEDLDGSLPRHVQSRRLHLEQNPQIHTGHLQLPVCFFDFGSCPGSSWNLLGQILHVHDVERLLSKNVSCL